MAAAQNRSTIVEERTDVRLVKSLEEEEYGLPSIVLDFTSEREDTVTVRFRDPIPEGVEPEEIGFHRDYGKDYWQIDGEHLSLEYELEPYEEFKTIYAFRLEDDEVSEDMLVPPATFEIEPGEMTVPDPEPMTRSGAESPYPETETAQSGSTDGGENTETAGGVDLDDSSIESPDQTSDAGSVAAALATELENDEVSSEDMEILAEHFAGLGSRSGSENARLRQLQEDVSDLRAYANALEEFLDEEGSAKAILEELRSNVNTFEEELNAVQARTNSLEATVDTIESEVDRVEESVESVSAELEDLRADMQSFEDEFEGLDERVPPYSIDERFADLQDELDTVDEFVGNLRNAFE